MESQSFYKSTFSESEPISPEERYTKALGSYYLGMTAEEMKGEELHDPSRLAERVVSVLNHFRGFSQLIDTNAVVSDPFTPYGKHPQTRKIDEILTTHADNEPEFIKVIHEALALQKKIYEGYEPSHILDADRSTQLQTVLIKPLKQYPWDGIAWSEEDAERIKQNAYTHIDEQAGFEILAFGDSFRKCLGDFDMVSSSQSPLYNTTRDNVRNKLRALFRVQETDVTEVSPFRKNEVEAANAAKQLQQKINSMGRDIPRYVREHYMQHLVDLMIVNASTK